MKPTMEFPTVGIMEIMSFITRTRPTSDSLGNKHPGLNIGLNLLFSNPQFHHVNGGSGGVKKKWWDTIPYFYMLTRN